MTPTVIRPLFFDAWATCRVVVGDRQIAKFRTMTEAEAYVTKLEKTTPAVPGSVNAELQALADELASALRLRGGKWKRKIIEEEDVVDAELNTELPF